MRFLKKNKKKTNLNTISTLNTRVKRVLQAVGHGSEFCFTVFCFFSFQHWARIDSKAFQTFLEGHV